MIIGADDVLSTELELEMTVEDEAKLLGKTTEEVIADSKAAASSLDGPCMGATTTSDGAAGACHLF